MSYSGRKNRNNGEESREENNYGSFKQRATKRPHSSEEGGGYSDKAAKIMKMMGFRKGQGLGKNEQGISEPIKVHERKGRRGLGHEIRNLDDEEPIPPGLEWNIEEVVETVEKFSWIQHADPLVMPSMKTLRSWLKIGKKKLIIDDETEFVNPVILKYILRCKNALDEFTDDELFKARSRSNPYETIRKGIFINRAAMKMANMDAILDMEITSPKTIIGEPSVKENELFYFADICAGPGGFSEYVLWRKSWRAKGFGFTLKGDCDFKLSTFVSGPPESFEPHYGVKEDGDIYNPDNCQAFINYVLQQTEESGVHLVMADGGFSVKGQENIQEILSRQLYLSQATVALGIVREGGHFICKLFDVFTAFSVGIVYLMRFCFEEVALIKPNTSRPANSERYLICKWRKEHILPVYEYLRECHEEMWSWKKGTPNENNEILEIVPLQLLKSENDPFYHYILQGNNETGIRQIQNLRKIVSFWVDNNLKEHQQFETRNKCLEYWDVDVASELRRREVFMNPLDKFRSLLEKTGKTQWIGNNFFQDPIPNRDLTPTLQKSEFRSPYNWKICVVENGNYKKNRGFFLSTGRSNIFKYDGYGEWKPLEHYTQFQMANNTLVYGEIVTEYKGFMPNQTKTSTFHIIDALILGDKDISNLSLGERNEWCKLFAKSMNKTWSVSQQGSFRAKELVSFEDFKVLHSKLQHRNVIGGGKVERLLCPVSIEDGEEGENESPLIQPAGIIFLQEIREPWLVAISRKTQGKYYFDHKTGVSIIERPKNAIADFIHSIKTRIFWEWDNKVNLDYPRENDNDSRYSANVVHAQEIIEYIYKIQRGGVK